ncbi:MAG TPA: Rrf2 family transcriptional regulator [Phycisphaerales bacterium]|nr:Rrf2 family transcriptional regulator [Phycisphaerales bacterium]
MVSPSVGYAASAMGHLAVHGDGPIRVDALARAVGAPPAYLAKLVHILSRKGLLDTAKGKGGGVRLSADARTVTLFDLCVALDDDILHPTCALGIAECSDERACPAHALQVAIRDEQLAFLKRTTILSVGEFNAKRSATTAAPPATTGPSTHGA